MKSVLILIALMCSQSALACLGEAQVIAVIKQVQKNGMINGHDCAVEAGSSLNGVIVLNTAGVLRLE
ncbi:MAG: hypothetical protein H7326_10665 [Bdellovibrionaceae bacterium]|nr:hypothetical protein [Pseudobdellovibrionaceae bacterium]